MKESEKNGWTLKPGEKENRNKLPEPTTGAFPKNKIDDT